jgi:hypothetical protein
VRGWPIPANSSRTCEKNIYTYNALAAFIKY